MQTGHPSCYSVLHHPGAEEYPVRCAAHCGDYGGGGADGAGVKCNGDSPTGTAATGIPVVEVGRPLVVAGDPFGKGDERRGDVEPDVVGQYLGPGHTDQRDPEGLPLKRVMIEIETTNLTNQTNFAPRLRVAAREMESKPRAETLRRGGDSMGHHSQSYLAGKTLRFSSPPFSPLT